MYAVIELGNSSQTHETTPKKTSDGSLSVDFFDVKMDVERYNIHGGAITVKVYENTMFGGKKWSEVTHSHSTLYCCMSAIV